MDYQVVHSTLGRIRFRIPRLAHDSAYISRLKDLVESLEYVKGVRVNALASSLVVQYEMGGISSAVIQENLSTLFQKASSAEDTAEPMPVTADTPATEPEGNLVSRVSPESASVPLSEVTEAEESETIAAADTPAIEEQEGSSVSSDISEPASIPVVKATQEAGEPETTAVPDSQQESQRENVRFELTQKELAQRLGLASQSLTARRSKPDFTDWSRSQDPEGIAWSYDPNAKTFYSVM